MRRSLALLLAGALLLSLVPAVVYAVSGGVTGQTKGGNSAPTISAVSLVESTSDNVVTAMTPLSPYRVKVTAGDINTIDDIREIEFHVFYQTDGAQWDADALAIFKWSKASGWSMQNGTAATTWELVAIDCTAPADFSGTTGDWYLKFKPGKLAQATSLQGWRCSAIVRDESKSDAGVWGAGASMSAYSELAFDATGVVFGDAIAGIEPGSTGYITDPAANRLTVRVTSNAQYSLGVKSAATWSGGSNTIALSGLAGVPSAAEQFSLTIDNQSKGGGLPGQPKKPQAMTGSTVTVSGYEAVSRVTTGVGAPEGTGDHLMYMGMSLSLMGIQEVVYSGTITFTTAN